MQEIEIEYRAEPGVLFVDIFNMNPEMIGLKAKLKLNLQVKVNDSRPVNSSKNIISKSFVITSMKQSITLEVDDHFYHYKGEKIRIYPELLLHINDSVFFDTKVSKKITKILSRPPRVSTKANKMLNPKDSFDWSYNIQSISSLDKVITIFLLLIGAIVIIINFFIGAHDQFVSESATYLYSHFDSDGDISSPFLKALGGNGSIGFTIWILIRARLRRYMTFAFRKGNWVREKRDHVYKISDMLTGKSRVDLNNVTLKIVAANIEKGKYTRGSGTKTRTISFSHPTRAVEIFSKSYDYIPKEVEITEYLKGDVSFIEMYKHLYPELKTTGKHGIMVRWEVQLIHNKLIDQELIGTQDLCGYIKFLNAK